MLPIEESAAVENHFRFQAEILEMVVSGQQLPAILDAVARYVESQSDDLRCSIAYIDAELRFRPASAPSLPSKYHGAFDGVPIYPYIGPCGLAAYQNARVISENIDADDRWSHEFRSLTKELGLKAVWSIPVTNGVGSPIATCAVFSLHTGAPNSRHLHLSDIAGRLVGVAIETQLRQDRQRLCSEIIERSTEALRILDPQGKIIEQNAAHRDLFGIPDELLLGRTSAAIFGEEQFREISLSFETETSLRKDMVAVINGNPRIIDVTVFPVRNGAGTIVCYASLNRDVTDNRRAQDELRKSNSELEVRVAARTSQLQRLSARLMKTQDEERRRIARELHDSAGQYLAAIQMDLSFLRDSPAITEREKERIIDSLELAERCTAEIRTISYLLHPPLLDEMGLHAAIQSYVDGFGQRSGIRVKLDIPDGLRRLPAEIETAVFRVIQQSLANIHRHSESRVAGVQLREEPERVTVLICDEGRGISPEKLAEFKAGSALFGVGIAGMRERVRDLQGQFDIRSSDTGTTIEITLPILENSKSANA